MLHTMKRISLPRSKRDILRTDIFRMYVLEKYSVAAIANKFSCSENKINYWLSKYSIKKRSISDAMYIYKNPHGDPFLIREPKTLAQGILFGLGIGLYWGEGSKKGTGGARLTNTDPKIIRKFIDFLEMFFEIDRNKLRFSIQIFNDLSRDATLEYWVRELRVKKDQFYKTIVSKIRGKGTYKHRSEHGVIIIYFNNIRLKKIILHMT